MEMLLRIPSVLLILVLALGQSALQAVGEKITNSLL